MPSPTYEELLAENKWLREQNSKTERQVLDELIQLLMADDEPLVKVKPEAFEYRIYDLELEYMMQLANSPESDAAKESMERVIANYHQAYPDRPLSPRPRPVEGQVFTSSPHFGPPRKERKPYTKRKPQ